MRFASLTGCCVLLLAACASSPGQKAAPAAALPANPAVAAPVVPAAPATEGAAAATTGDVAVGSGSMQVRAPAPVTGKTRPGYKLRRRNGEAVYCRRETPTGSRMPIETCYTAAQLETLDQQTEVFKDAVEQTRTRCTGPACGSGS